MLNPTLNIPQSLSNNTPVKLDNTDNKQQKVHKILDNFASINKLY